MFKSARIKLTAWYLLIIMLISIAFSLFIHNFLVLELNRFALIQKTRIERRLSEERHFIIDPNIPIPPYVDPELFEETKNRITIILVLLNAVIFIFSGGTGYVLAGRTLKPIRDMVDEQNRFVSDASHELRTPLTSLKTAMEVALRNDTFNIKEAKTLIKENILEVNKLELLSGSLLRLSEVQQTIQNNPFQEVPFDLVIKEAIQKIHILAKAKEIIITNQTKQTKVLGDKNSLIELFVILLDNAVKYSQKQSTIVISDRKMNDSIEIVIKDSGIGIAQKDLQRIFDRFYRADSARQKKDLGGFGLGLSIAKEIVSRHQGNIFVNSKVDKGTEVHIVLPVKKIT